MFLMVPHEMDGHHAAGDRQLDPAARFGLMPRYRRMRESSRLEWRDDHLSPGDCRWEGPSNSLIPVAVA